MPAIRLKRMHSGEYQKTIKMSQQAQHFCLKWNNHSSNFITSFAQLLKNEALTDVTLAVEDGASIKCHKMVLAACSKYFEDLFMKNSYYEQHPIIIISGVKLQEMHAVLDYMYKGEVNVAQEEIAGLMKVANFLKVKGLAQQSEIKRENPEPPASPRPGTSLTNGTNGINGSAYSNGYISPSRLSSSATAPYGKYPTEREQQQLFWAAQTFPQLLVPHHPISGHHPLSPSQLELLNKSYENASEMSPLSRKKTISNLMANLDTPILRNVLGQGQEFYSQDRQDSSYRSNSNCSANDLDRRNSSELSESMMEEDDRPSTSQRQSSRSGDPKEWKRYKQYTRQNILDAMEAVRSKTMSALQAATRYKIPSRTLYDKLKKAGILAARNGSGRRPETSNYGSAQFPYANDMNGNIYGHHHMNGDLPEHEANGILGNGVMHHENDVAMEVPPRSPSPLIPAAHAVRHVPHRSPSPPAVEREAPIANGHAQQDEIEDLSVNRRPNIANGDVAGVIVPPLSIKEEDKSAESDDSSRV